MLVILFFMGMIISCYASMRNWKTKSSETCIRIIGAIVCIIYCIENVKNLRCDLEINIVEIWSMFYLITWNIVWAILGKSTSEETNIEGSEIDDVMKCVIFIIGILFVNLFLAVILCYVTAIIFYIILNQFDRPCDTIHTDIQTYPIISVIDSTDTKGNIEGNGGFLVWEMSGSITQENIYLYYYELEDGGKKQDKCPVDLTTIYYVEKGEKTYIEIITSTICETYNSLTDKHYPKSSNIEYKLYIPEGSICEKFELNGN